MQSCPKEEVDKKKHRKLCATRRRVTTKAASLSGRQHLARTAVQRAAERTANAPSSTESTYKEVPQRLLARRSACNSGNPKEGGSAQPEMYCDGSKVGLEGCAMALVELRQSQHDALVQQQQSGVTNEEGCLCRAAAKCSTKEGDIPRRSAAKTATMERKVALRAASKTATMKGNVPRRSERLQNLP